MRVAYICSDSAVPIFGDQGCSFHVQEFIRALIEAGAQVEVFAASIGNDKPSFLEDAVVHPLPVRGPEHRSACDSVPFAANEDLVKILSERPRFHLIYERYSPGSFAAVEYALANSVPAIVEINAPLIEEQEYRSLINRTRAEDVLARVFQAAHSCITVSKQLATHLTERFRELGNKIHVIPNAVNPKRFPHGIEPTFPCQEGTYTLGFLLGGTLKPRQGLKSLVEGFALLKRRQPNVRLLIVGDGPQRNQLASDFASRGVNDSVVFTGKVPQYDVPGLLASMDVALAPYSPDDNFYFSPLKIYEYMAAALPVVASEIGQIREVIVDELNGLLTPPGDPVALAIQTHRLLQNSELRMRLGQTARETILRSYTWQSVIRRVITIAGLKFPTVGLAYPGETWASV